MISHSLSSANRSMRFLIDLTFRVGRPRGVPSKRVTHFWGLVGIVDSQIVSLVASLSNKLNQLHSAWSVRAIILSDVVMMKFSF